MTDGALLLRGNLEQPDCDTARLVLADWLEEHGQGERAEFIRVQIEIARWELTTGDKLITGPERQRERELWPAAVFNILDGVRPGKVIPDDMVVYKIDEYRASGSAAYVSRGFISRIELPCADFLTHAKGLFRQHPVTSVKLTGRAPRQRPISQMWSWAYISNNDIDTHIRTTTNNGYVLPGCLRIATQSFSKRGSFDTREDAEDAVSFACVAFGRSEADLSPLPAHITAG